MKRNIGKLQNSADAFFASDLASHLSLIIDHPRPIIISFNTIIVTYFFFKRNPHFAQKNLALVFYTYGCQEGFRAILQSLSQGVQ